ncbi:hypothetical protein BGX30_015217 [Mortierella sp. GBA39]|nr:hypothetical protein BGX30_015217 [Mortierella sp. GBA39]
MDGDKIQSSLDKNQKDARDMAEEVKQKVHNKIAKRYGSLDRNSSIERDAIESFKSKEGETVKTKLFEMLRDEGDVEAAFASGILEVTDKESAAAWTVDIGDNAAARSQRKAGCTLLVKDFSGIDGTGQKSNAHEGDEEQLVGDHFEVQKFGS